MIRDTDLPAAVRKRLGLPTATRARPPGRSVTTGGRWVCVRCDEDLRTWVAVDRHSAATGHRTYSIPLTSSG
jgi:hypothetical protein